MDQLEIRLLGSFQVSRAGSPLAGFESNKVRALLAYLAVESDRPHRRRKLAALLWPDLPESAALNNLRFTLSNLRQVIRDRTALPAYLDINPQDIRFILANNIWLDVRAFENNCLQGKQNPLDLRCLENAAELYRGKFLEGFAIPDSSSFEEWLLLKREHFDRLAIQVFSSLANDREISANYQQAIEFAKQQLAIDPWREEEHRRLMRCLYFSGQRSAALAQYEACRRELAKELSVKPEQETHQLYTQMHEGKLSPPPIPPSFLQQARPQQADRLHFVARREPLQHLNNALNRALAGQSQIMLVTGSPGQGKSALVQEFIRRALQSYVSLASAWGNSRAYFGSGDPYLPFREILEMLTGQVEQRWEAGSISQEHALRLWRLTPYTAQALIQNGPGLIGTFIHGKELFQRASMVAQAEPAWLSSLQSLVGRQPGGAPLSQQDLFQQYCRVLASIARQIPLLLFVDDLQWADQSSLTLIFHLSRELTNSRILIIMAFRPIETDLSSGIVVPPLAAMINELRLSRGDILINLDELEERGFIDAYLDLEPNQLDEAFRQKLFHYTHGHPLFTVEMLYGMQERGDLTKNAKAEWVVSPSSSWDILPTRVEAVIAERLRQLPPPLIKLLQIASIEGEYFTSEVLAKVQGLDENQVLMQLRSELDQHYWLVQAVSTRLVENARISRYRFRHILYQIYLYSQLELVERSRLHEQVGLTLEEFYPGVVDEIAVQLAIHFEIAGAPLKAIHYLQAAGLQATRMASYEDAIVHLRKALDLLELQPESVDRNMQELDLLQSINAPIMLRHGYASPELGFVNSRTAQLLNLVPLKPEMWLMIGHLGSYYIMRAEYTRCLPLATLAKQAADSSGNEFFVHFGDFMDGLRAMWLGEIKQAFPHIEQMVDFYDPNKLKEMHHLLGSDPGIDSLSWGSWDLWLLGYPERALKYGDQAIAIGHSLEDPGCQGMSQVLAILLRVLMKETTGIDELINSCSKVLTKYSLPLMSADLEIAHGYYLVLSGDMDNGLEIMSRGTESYQAIGTRNALSMRLTLLADAYLRNSELALAGRLLQQVQDFITETGEGFYLAETLRVKGELLMLHSPPNTSEAENLFNQALQVAHEQEAKSLELRAVMSLSRLLKEQDRSLEACQLLSEIYDWFTEGFGTHDLLEARTLLRELHS